MDTEQCCATFKTVTEDLNTYQTDLFQGQVKENILQEMWYNGSVLCCMSEVEKLLG